MLLRPGLLHQATTTSEGAGTVLIPGAFLVVAGLVVLLAGGFALALWRRRWLILDLPTSEAAHVFVGVNEVVGTAAPVDDPLVAPWSATECVWYRAILEKEVQQGDSKSWKTITDEESSAPFWVEDRTGRVLVRPKGASVDAPRAHRSSHGGKPERYGRFTLLNSLAGTGPSLSFDAANHRTTEWQLRPGDPVYVLGDARLRRDAVALELVSRPERRMLVALGDEEKAAKRSGGIALTLLVVTLLAVATIPVSFHNVRTFEAAGPVPGSAGTIDAAGGAMVLGAALVLAVFALLYVGRLFNRLVAVRNRAQAAWSLIDVQLRRRHDLLPALAEVVRAAAAYEQATFVDVAESRTLPADLPDDPDLERATRLDEADQAEAATLLARAEAYPTLTADERYQALAAEITRTEDAVAFARGFYNDAINILRDRRQQFPGRFLAPFVRVPSLALWTDAAVTPRGSPGRSSGGASSAR